MISRTRESKLTCSDGGGGQRRSEHQTLQKRTNEDYFEFSYLSWRQYRYEVVVDAPRLLLNRITVGALAQVLARLPEHDVLFAVLALQKVAKHFPTG